MGPTNVDEIFSLLDQDKYLEAKNLIYPHIEELSDSWWMLLASINLDLGQYQENIDLYKMPHEWLKAKNKAVYDSFIAESLHFIGKNKEAYDLYKKSFKKLKHDAHFMASLAYFFSDIGMSNTLKVYKRAIKLDKEENFMLYLRYGAYLESINKNQEAIEASRIAIKIDPNKGYAHYNLGVALAKIGKVKEAKEAYLEEIKKDKFEPYAYYNLGLIYKDEKQYEDAKYYYLKAIDAVKDYYANTNFYTTLYGNSWFNLLCVYAIEKNYSEATNCLRMVQLVYKSENDEYLRQDDELKEYLECSEFKEVYKELFKDKYEKTN